MDSKKTKTCSKCNSTFGCGGNCWCNKYPSIIPLTQNMTCLCPDCLHLEMVKKINSVMANLTSDMKLEIKNLPERKLIKDIDFVLDKEGNKEYTSWYKLRH